MNKKVHNYARFTEEEFICDPFFQDWVLHARSTDNDFWENFLVVHPNKSKDVAAAKAFLLLFQETEPAISNEYIAGKAAAMINGWEEQAAQPQKRPVIKAWLLAAVFTGIVVLSGFLLHYHFIQSKTGPQQLSVTTPPGKLQALLLPDSSSVMLNANSRISYTSNWQGAKPREIWLEGEAFFSVKHLNTDKNHIAPGEKFIVHTTHLDVTVLGTAFDIRERRGKTEVVLQTGSINISIPGKKTLGIILTPGDCFTYLHNTKETIKTTTHPGNYTAWREKTLLLNNPTLEEITGYLEDTYGKKFIIEDKKLSTRSIEGPIRLNSLDNVLFIISTVLNVTTVQTDSTIIIRSR